MINTLKKMMVGLVGATFMIGAMAPVSAAPVLPTAQVVDANNVMQVRDRWDRRGHGNWNGHRPGRPAGMDTVPVRARVGTIIARVQVIGMAIAAITTIAMAIVVIMMAGGIRWQLSALGRSSVVQSLSQHLSRFTALVIAMFSGAITATDHIALRTIRSSHIMVRASSAIRLTADRSRNPKNSRLKRVAVFICRSDYTKTIFVRLSAALVIAFNVVACHFMM